MESECRGEDSGGALIARTASGSPGAVFLEPSLLAARCDEAACRRMIRRLRARAVGLDQTPPARASLGRDRQHHGHSGPVTLAQKRWSVYRTGATSDGHHRRGETNGILTLTNPLHVPSI